MKKFFQLVFSCLFLSVFVAGCTAEMEEDVGSVEQALQGCGVEVINHWTEPFGSGVISVAYMKNLGGSPCNFRWQYEVKKGGVSTYSPVFPSATTWLTLQPNQQVNHSFQYPNVTSPCTSRMHLKMGSTWYAGTYVNCF